MKKLFVLAFSTLIFVSACGNGPATENQEENDAVAVTIEEIQPSTFKHYLNIQGTVESDKTISITPKVTATVEEINVQAGDQVEKGTVLARLDGEVTRTQIEEVKTRLKLAETRYERQKNLREDNIGSEIQLLEVETQVRSLENQLATLQEQFEYYTIRATIGGTVNRVMLKEGETAVPSSPAFQIANAEALKVTAEISEAYITRIDRTDSVRVRFPSLNREITKTIDVVSKVIDPSNRTFSIEIYISNLDETVRPNMLAKLRVNDVTRANEVVVPLNAVQQPEGDAFVYLAKQGDPSWIASRQSIELGLSYNDQILIEEGLRPGDRLVTVGYNALSDQTPIAIQEN
ncbi:efflux RND transporter periplasmic adaptor subunit [Fodinibius sp.]|uniref:efflux RND transporter periplasmic adaptor subunit n=1 Tax=Fodinibius sp. TaxID=1872440 RepID=UPI002ACE15EB|nr:efflux RND transporter periplasmic adaptor subunit [Fodinibius sp.]MDZ7658753.1 efflux RND transporter periplasmic adaptor subunit [Fodinibius sp.]